MINNKNGIDMERKRDGKKLVISLIFGIALLFAYIFGSEFATKITNSVFSNPQIDQLASFATQIITCIIACFFMRKMYNVKLDPSCKNMAVGMVEYGAGAWIFICLNIWEKLVTGYTIPELPVTKVIFIVAISLLNYIGVGIAEEVICRGIFFNAYMKFFGDNKKGVIISTILSSAMFGSAHALNLIGQPELIVHTIAQIIYAILFGALFCAVYYRTGNLWPGIILHGLVDFASLVFRDLNPEMVSTDDTIFMGIMSVAVVFVAFVMAMVQFNTVFKNKKAESIEANA